MCAQRSFLCVSLKCFQQLAYLQSSLDKLSEAIKLAKVVSVRVCVCARVCASSVQIRTHLSCVSSRDIQGQPDSVQEALRFTMDVIGGK